MKMTAFSDVAPLSVVEVDRRFRGSYCLHHQGGTYSSSTSTRLYGAMSHKAVNVRIILILLVLCFLEFR
jgi:hypothetical protein